MAYSVRKPRANPRFHLTSTMKLSFNLLRNSWLGTVSELLLSLLRRYISSLRILRIFRPFTVRYIYHNHLIRLARCNLPVMLSQSIRDVMILPYGLKRFSRSCCVMFFGKPLTYRFAPLIASLLGLAYDTWGINQWLVYIWKFQRWNYLSSNEDICKHFSEYPWILCFWVSANSFTMQTARDA